MGDDGRDLTLDALCASLRRTTGARCVALCCGGDGELLGFDGPAALAGPTGAGTPPPDLAISVPDGSDGQAAPAVLLVVGPAVTGEGAAAALADHAAHAADRLEQLRLADQLEAERERRHSAEHRYRMLVEGSPVSIAVYRVSDGRFVYANPQAVELYGADDRAGMLARHAHEVVPDDDFETWRRRVRLVAQGGTLRQATGRIRRFDGELLSVEVNAARIDLDGEVCVQVELRDITRRTREAAAERARLEDELCTDPLTGARNRRGWDRELPAHVGHAARMGQPLTVAVFDLDRFKAYNDTFGHPAGDALLQELVIRWKQLVRTTDTLARLGGEEFALAVPGSPLTTAKGMAETLRAHVPAGLSASCGLAEWDGSERPEQLVARADQALYEAKRAGRDCVRVAGTSDSATSASNAPRR